MRLLDRPKPIYLLAPPQGDGQGKGQGDSQDGGIGVMDATSVQELGYQPKDLEPVIITGTVVKDEYLFEFQHWIDFVDQAEYGKTDMSGNLRASRDGRRDGRDAWHGATFPEAIKLARIGWPDGVKRIQERLDIIKAHIPAKRLVQYMEMRSVGPGTLDMDRYLEGHPEPWVTWQRRPDDVEDPTGKIVTIMFNISASWAVSNSAMFTKGALACALIDLLERSGRRVELVLIMSTKSGSRSITSRILVKRPEDLLDIDRIAFCIAHSACFRRLGFSVWEQAPEDWRETLGIYHQGGYGYCNDITDPTAINILSSDLNNMEYSEAKQLIWLKEQLAKQGLELEIDSKTK